MVSGMASHILFVIKFEGAKSVLFSGDSRRAQELCESPGGRPGLPIPNSPDGLCGRKATLNVEILV